MKTKENTVIGECGMRAKSNVSFMMCGFKQFEQNYGMKTENEHIAVQFERAFLGKGQILWAKEKSDARGLYEFRMRLRQALVEHLSA